MAIFSGERPTKLILPIDFTETRLKKDGDTWMSTHPVETYTQIYPAVKAHGDVLVGGLGLGYVVREMQKNKFVKSITIVEWDEEVINLIQPLIETTTTVIVHADIKKYLSESRNRFDFIYLDTWTGTGETEFYTTAVPLRRLAYRLLRRRKGEHRQNNLVCWMEDVMRGQIIHGLLSHKAFGFVWLDKMNDKDRKEFKKANPIVALMLEKHGKEALDAMDMQKYTRLCVGVLIQYATTEQ